MISVLVSFIDILPLSLSRQYKAAMNRHRVTCFIIDISIVIRRAIRWSGGRE
jgi:hypothetical protein